MTHRNHEVRALLAALREDLPTTRDEARVRRKLASAGIALGAAAVSSSAAGKSVPIALGAKSALGEKLEAVSSVTKSSATKGGAMLSKLTLPAQGTAASVASSWAGLSVAGKALVAAGALAVCASYPIARWGGTAPKASHAAAASAENAPTQGLPLGEDPKVEPGQAAERIAEQDQNAGRNVHPQTDGMRHGGDVWRGDGASGHGARSSNAARSKRRHEEPLPRVGAGETTQSSLAEEARLIEHALKASRANDVTVVARLLAEHERRFPRGRLAKERERIRVQLAE